MPKVCADCGPDAVDHFTEWMNGLLECFFYPFSQIFGGISRVTVKFLRPLAPSPKMMLAFFKFLVSIGIGIIYEGSNEHDSLRTKALWESAIKREIKMWKFRLFETRGLSIFVATKNNKWLIFEGLPRPADNNPAALAWMDNKAILKKKLSKAGFPVARGGAYFFYFSALRTFNRIDKPVITKPHIGSRSRHTTVHLNDSAEFRKAFYKAKQLSPFAIVEEALTGMVHRASIINGKLEGIIRREPPFVIGDGKTTLKKLWEQENTRPERRGQIFHEIPNGEETEIELKKQGYSWRSIPKAGVMVFFHQKVSRAFGASTTDFTNTAHPDNVKLFEDLSAYLKDAVVGIDFIIQDITKSWRKQKKCGVIELNSLPFLDLHHYPLNGEPHDVCGKLWDLVFKL